MRLYNEDCPEGMKRIAERERSNVTADSSALQVYD